METIRLSSRITLVLYHSRPVPFISLSTTPNSISVTRRQTLTVVPSQLAAASELYMRLSSISLRKYASSSHSPRSPCANPDFCQCIFLLSTASTKLSKELKTSLKRHPHSKFLGLVCVTSRTRSSKCSILMSRDLFHQRTSGWFSLNRCKRAASSR